MGEVSGQGNEFALCSELPKPPGEVVAVSRPRRHLPRVDGVLVQGAVAPVEVRPGNVQDGAVGAQLRVVRAARAVLKESADEVSGNDGELASRTVDTPGADARGRAMRFDGLCCKPDEGARWSDRVTCSP